MFGSPKQLIMYLATSCDDNKTYEIKERKEKRTERQNRYLWELLTLCVEKETGRKNKDDIDNLYMRMLEYTGAKVDYMLIIEEALERLKNEVRLVIPLGKVKEGNKEFLKVKMVYGSSKLDTKEMGLLIDNLLDYASNLGIDTNYWKEMLK